MNNTDKIADLVKELRKDTSLGENDNSEGSDGTIFEDDISCSNGSEDGLSSSIDTEDELSSCSGDSVSYTDSGDSVSCTDSGDSEEELSCTEDSEDSDEELTCNENSEKELSCSGDSGEELSCSDSGDSEEELTCSSDSEEELSYIADSEDELSCTDDSEKGVSCSDGSEEELSYDSEDELSEGKSTGLTRLCSEEDSFQMLPYQSSSEEPVQKIDAVEAAERKRLWEEETKAYYDR